MEAIAVTNKGIEEISAKEIKELIRVNTRMGESIVIFKPKKLLDLCLLCYKAQSLTKVMLLLKEVEFKKKEDIFSSVKDIDLKDFLDKKTSFEVRCKRIGKHDFSSQEIEEKTGEKIIELVKDKYKFTPKVNLENPDLMIFVYICNNKAYLGIDFSGIDLSKRQYRIFAHPEALKATISYAMIRLIDYKKTDFLLDTFCNDGTIPIEAALFATKIPINFYQKDKFAFLKLKPFKKTDFEKFFENKINLKEKIKVVGYDPQLRDIKAAQKNAKIAGVNKLVTFSKVDVGWLDTKFKKGEVDKIAANLPSTSYLRESEIEKQYNEFFYQADFVLSKKGKICLAVKTLKYFDILQEKAKKYKFKLTKEIDVSQGEQTIKLVIFQKQ